MFGLSKKNAQKSTVTGNNNQVVQLIDYRSGPGYLEIKQMVSDLVEQNMLRFSNEATRIINARKDTFIDQLLTLLQQINPEGFQSFADPGFQSVLITALQQYAKTGDEELQHITIDMLVKRTMLKNRELSQIAIDEAVAVIGKISSKQLYLIALIYLTAEQQRGFHTLQELGEYFSSVISGQHFYQTENPSQAREEMAHLGYAGCLGNYGLADDYTSALIRHYDYALGTHPDMLKSGLRDILQRRFIPESEAYQIVSKAENRAYICKEDIQAAIQHIYPTSQLFEHFILATINKDQAKKEADKLLEIMPFNTLHMIYELYSFGGYYLTPVGKSIARSYIKLNFPSPYQLLS
jgi:hypothetical protein